MVGAGLPYRTILILGAANLLADGFSMAASNYMSTRTQSQELDLFRKSENRKIDSDPQGGAEEIRKIFVRQGYSGDLLEKNIDFVLKHRQQWVSLMLTEEHGLATQTSPPLRSASATFVAFVLFGCIPLLAYVFGTAKPFFWSIFFTGLSFLTIGSLKSRWTSEKAWVSAIKTLLLGGVASVIAYAVGYLLKNIGG